MTGADGALRFWLRFVERTGGLWEDAGDTTLVVLPERLQDEYDQPGELEVTADPDVAREDGVQLLVAGHPWPVRAAEAVIDEGDCGLVRLPRPGGPAPPDDQLLAAARDEFPVDHGRIDAAGPAVPATRWAARVGALVSYAVSAEMTFQEELTCWVDVPAALDLAHDIVERLDRSLDGDQLGRCPEPPPSGDLMIALAHAHRRFDEAADRRAIDLSRHVGAERDREAQRAEAYYAEALTSLRRRLTTAAPERAATLVAKIDSTGAERARRLAEIEEKYRPAHGILPFRLHAVLVPTLSLPVDVRRGDRRYPLVVDWLLPARRFAPLRCPSCGGTASLVAGKAALGCAACLSPPPAPPPLSRAAPAATAASPPRGPSAAAAPGSLDPRPTPGPTDSAESPAESARPRQSGSAGRPARTGPSTARRAGPDRTGPSSAARRPAAPPGARPLAQPLDSPAAALALSGKAVQKAGRKLIVSLWDLVAAGDRRVQRLYAPNSPAAALHRLFGNVAPLVALGLRQSDRPEAWTASGSAQAFLGSGLMVIDGAVESPRGRHPYQVVWGFVDRTALIAEITPFAGADWPRLPDPLFYRLVMAGSGLVAHIPATRATLDPVATAIWGAVATEGLSVTARSLAAWWRIEPDAQALARHAPVAVAAAVARVVGFRAGGRGHYDDIAATFKTEVGAVRAASAVVQRALDLSDRRPW